MNKRSGLIAAGIACVLVAAGGTANAASSSIPDSNGNIYVCYDSGGNMRVINPSATTTCPKGWTGPLKMNENQTPGPAGPSGAPGQPGPQGSPGPSTAGTAGLDTIIVEAGGTSQAEFAYCPADHPYVVGGGGYVEGASLVGSWPLSADGPGTSVDEGQLVSEGQPIGWEAQGPANSTFVEVYAICAK